MNHIHKNAAQGRWQQFSFSEQLANIGIEVGRTANAKDKDQQGFEGAKNRAIELFDLTINDPKWKAKARLIEIIKAKEIFCDTFKEKPEYNISLKDLESYFFHFMLLARKNLK